MDVRDEPMSFAQRVIDWQRRAGRHDLPWQASRDPYRIWLSEVMLQQTQVQTVIPYYLRFLEAFANVRDLAHAPLDRVMELWSGLGYYSRARNLHRCAQVIESQHGGHFPRSSAELQTLPGIGESTAAAIAAFAFGERAAILDGNVKRVVSRHFGIEGWPGERRVLQALWERARRELPTSDIERYTQGLMDLGASLCARSRPACERCPVRASCVAAATGRQAALPAARPRRATPERATTMLIITHGDAVWLERRPPTGIWGGLLSPPETNGTELSELARQTEQRFGGQVTRARLLPVFWHAFTHYRLCIQPALLSLETVRRRVAEGPGQWVGWGELGGQALAAPVRTLLGLLADERSERGSSAG
jgi:A/G-specific adenine glycosylase